jgi:hypothetical protein
LFLLYSYIFSCTCIHFSQTMSRVLSEEKFFILGWKMVLIVSTSYILFVMKIHQRSFQTEEKNLETIDKYKRPIFLIKIFVPFLNHVPYFLKCLKSIVSVSENWHKNKYKDTFFTILFYMCLFCLRIWYQFSPILTKLFKHSRKCEGYKNLY